MDIGKITFGPTPAPGTPEHAQAAGLQALIERSRKWWEGLTPEQQAEHRERQRKAWVHAEDAFVDEGTRVLTLADAVARIATLESRIAALEDTADGL